jgi:hypothetical protein
MRVKGFTRIHDTFGGTIFPSPGTPLTARNISCRRVGTVEWAEPGRAAPIGPQVRLLLPV